MNVLVTGGAGFIGSHLVDHLIYNGDNVTILDNLSSGKISNVSKASNFILGDINNTELLKEIFNKIDFCYHLAAIPSIKESIENWVESHTVNLVGTINIFLAAKERKIPVVYASSAAVYGDTKILPLSESSKVNAISPYGLDKYCCEQQAKAFFHIYGLKTIGLRFFNVYGSRQNTNSSYSGVISLFIEKIKHNEILNVYGDGKQERDFIYINDIVKALLLAKSSVLDKDNIYNVCTGTAYSINFLINTLAEIFEQKLHINYLAPRLGDIHKSVGDIKKAKKELKFKASYSLKEGLTMLYSL